MIQALLDFFNFLADPESEHHQAACMMVAALAALGAILLSACGGNPGPVANVTPAAAVSPPPTPSPSPDPIPSPSASPSPSPTPIPKPVISITSAGKSLACRLPVTWEIQVDDYTRLHKSGFITFPTGKLTEDTSAPKMTMFYDRAYSKWLPAWRNDVSPDGRWYAYPEGNPISGATKGKLHLVDVATGTDRVLYSGAPIFSVVDFAAEGIYLTSSRGDAYGRGLWLESTTGGTPRLINRSIIRPVLGDGAAWGIAFNPADRHPVPGGLDGPYNELTRVDLVTGSLTSFFYRPGTNIDPIGVDQDGYLWVAVMTSFSGAEDIWRVTSPTNAARITTFSSLPSPSYLAAIDSHGVWFGGGYTPDEVWLYVGGTFRAVATVKSSDSFAVAGGCIP